MCEERESGPRCDTHAIGRLIDRLCLDRGRLTENTDLHIDLLASSGGLAALASELRWVRNAERRELLLRAYRTGLAEHESRTTSAGRTLAPTEHPEGWDSVAVLNDPADIARASYGLYGYDKSPLRDKAVAADREFRSVIVEHEPGTPRTITLGAAEAADAQDANLDGLPDNTFAFDLETDTTHGRGLQPHKGKITELVLADKDDLVILSGDERHILQGFADYMNSRTAPAIAAGWNSRNFDLPYLLIRAWSHRAHLVGWKMELAPSPVRSPYPAVGGYKVGQMMRWITPSGVEHRDEDVMLTYAAQRGRRTAGLKASARECGMNPIELDRARLHEYTQQERDAYVASDGLATLHTLMVTRRGVQAQAAA